jgi:hypothetical protein
MSKRKAPKPGKCVHCLRNPVELNWDHVFPLSWYPDTTALNLEKWKVPSCYECNRQLGAIEQEFFVRIALCLNPNDPASRSIVQTALRSMRPEFAKNSSDRRKRISLAKRVGSEILEGNNIPDVGIYPALGERWGRAKGSGLGLVISADSFAKITEKIVRGITYLEGAQFIDSPLHVKFYALNEEGTKLVQGLVNAHGYELAREPGIVVRRVVAPEDGVSAIYEIEFWKQFKTHAAVTSEPTQ